MKLTPHFTMEELCASVTAAAHKIDNRPPAEIVPRLIRVAEMLERIRGVLGVPIRVNSGYRCMALNFAVGSKSTSDHVRGHAADIVAPDFGTPTKIAATLQPLMETLGIGQLILEGVRGHQWVHVSTHKPEMAINAVLTITDAGPTPGIHPLV